MATLPVHGQTPWDTVLESWFDVSLNTDGTLKTSAIGGGWVDAVRDYGAVADGLTDSTSALQAAIDAAVAAAVPCFIPAAPLTYQFSNLTLGAHCNLIGAGLGRTRLQQITGSTGIAVREKTSGEGNASGATTMIVRGMTILGTGAADSTTDGLNLGNQGSGNLESGGFLRDLYIANFANGAAFSIAGNATHLLNLWGMNSAYGIYLHGDGANFAHGLFAEDNTTYCLWLHEPYSRLLGIQIESSVANSQPLIRCYGGGSEIASIYVANNGGTSKPKLIQVENSPSIIRDVQIVNSGTFTDGVYFDTAAVGTGTDEAVFEFLALPNAKARYVSSGKQFDNSLSASDPFVAGQFFTRGGYLRVSRGAFPTTDLLDDCARGNEDPLSHSGSWTVGSTFAGLGWANLALSSHQIVADSSFAGGWWNASTFGPDTEVWCSINGSVDNTQYLYLRLTNPNSSSMTGYRIQIRKGNGTIVIAKATSGSAYTTLTTLSGLTLNWGDTIGAKVVGSTFTAYVNGISVGTTSDSSYSTAGYIGYASSDTALQITGFGGGTA